MAFKRSKISEPAAPTSSRKRVATDTPDQRPSKKIVTSRLKTAPKLPAQSSTRSVFLPSPARSSIELQVYVCGEGSSGELGLGAGKNVTDVKAPRPNTYLSSVVSIATGGMHAVALTPDNRLLTWGVNDLGTLGRDTTWEAPLRAIDADSDSDEDDDDMGLNPREATPTAVDAKIFPSTAQFVQAAAGDSTTFVLTDDGLVYGWGTFRDNNGVFGFTHGPNWKVGQIQREPLLIPGLKHIVQISAGADYALALDRTGKVFAWGSGQQCELGRRLLERRRAVGLLPARVEIPAKHKIVSIHAAANHAFAIDSNGDTWAWGSNNFGQTGVTVSAGQGEAIVSIPTRVPSLMGKRMSMIVGGMHHSVGLTEAGKCLAWGRIDGCQSGLDMSRLVQDHSAIILSDSADRPRILLGPVALPLPKCAYIAAGSDHTLAVTSSGKAYSWGFNATYQCGQGTSDDIMVAKLMEGKNVRDKHILWAGAGGQYSMLASKTSVQ